METEDLKHTDDTFNHVINDSIILFKMTFSNIWIQTDFKLRDKQKHADMLLLNTEDLVTSNTSEAPDPAALHPDGVTSP